MERILLLLLLTFPKAVIDAQEKVDISLAHGSKAEQETKAQLQRVLRGRHLMDDELLLSTFVHEQLHWFIAENRRDSEAAMKELRVLFPKIPVGFPEGSTDERG